MFIYVKFAFMPEHFLVVQRASALGWGMDQVADRDTGWRGSREGWLQAAYDALVEGGVDVVVVDTAHGHSRGVLQAVNAVKKLSNQVQVVGGNIATADAARA